VCAAGAIVATIGAITARTGVMIAVIAAKTGAMTARTGVMTGAIGVAASEKAGWRIGPVQVVHCIELFDGIQFVRR
jgi:hypothetical protein